MGARLTEWHGLSSPWIASLRYCCRDNHRVGRPEPRREINQGAFLLTFYRKESVLTKESRSEQNHEQRESGFIAGNTRHADLEGAATGADAWLRFVTTAQADVRGGLSGGDGVTLSRVGPVGKTRLGQRGVGRFGRQSQGALLLADAGRQKATRRGKDPVAAAFLHHQLDAQSNM